MKNFALLILAFLLVNCGTDATSREDTSTNTSASETSIGIAQFVKQTIAPPVPEIKWPDNAHQIPVKTGGQIELSSGTVVDVPVNAFVYANQKPVTGNVQINIREFHTAAEVILSGIPMRDWDQNEEEWKNFSTAGMFEITGTDEANQPVEIAAGHPLTVHLASQVEGTYGYWYFDEDKGDWEKQGQNTAKTLPPTNNPQTEEAAISNPPTVPRKYDTEKLRITFTGMNLADFPELNDPENIALQYNGKPKAKEDPQENQWIFTENWYKAEITKTGKAGVYQLYLENDDQDFTTYVHPTLLPKAYASALKDYHRNLANYETAMQNLAQRQQIGEQLRRSMQVNRFGNYNYDIYSRWEEPIFARASFQLNEGKNAWNEIDYIYLVTDKGLVSVRYPNSDWDSFNFDQARKNLLVGITSDANIVLMSPDDFTTQSANLTLNDKQQSQRYVMDGARIGVHQPETLQKLIDDYFAG